VNALARRLAYRVRPRLRRETCKRCWRENPVGFSVPDDVWRAVVPARHIDHVLCPTCFDRYATARRVDWTAKGCEFYAVPGVWAASTGSRRWPSWTCTRCIARPWSATVDSATDACQPFRYSFRQSLLGKGWARREYLRVANEIFQAAAPALRTLALLRVREALESKRRSLEEEIRLGEQESTVTKATECRLQGLREGIAALYSLEDS